IDERKDRTTGQKRCCSTCPKGREAADVARGAAVLPLHSPLVGWLPALWWRTDHRLSLSQLYGLVPALQPSLDWLTELSTTLARSAVLCHHQKYALLWSGQRRSERHYLVLPGFAVESAGEGHCVLSHHLLPALGGFRHCHGLALAQHFPSRLRTGQLYPLLVWYPGS